MRFYNYLVDFDCIAAYLLSSDVNVFVVDWGYLAKIPCYPAAAYNTRYVAKCVADLLIRLSLKYKEFIPYDVHIIGFRYVCDEWRRMVDFDRKVPMN